MAIIRRFGIILLTALCIFALLAVVSYAMLRRSGAPASGGQPMLPTTTVTVGSTTIMAEIARTQDEEQAGLSGRSSLPPGRGMLFLFDPPQMPGFWMKDMRFSLDIIFAAADGTIVAIYPDLSPATYPQAFRPQEPSAYVLEVSAGFAAAHGIAVGQKIVVQ